MKIGRLGDMCWFYKKTALKNISKFATSLSALQNILPHSK